MTGRVARLTGGVGLWAGGAASMLLLQHRLWASAAGVLLISLTVLRGMLRRQNALALTGTPHTKDEAVAWRGLLDQVPTPLIRVGHGAWALNRAARGVFGVDDAIAPVPPELLDETAQRLWYEGRTWRLDRVVTAAGSALIALVDVETERRLAEARADDEMVEVLGHELLNGLSPIVSLAESAAVAAERNDADLPALLATLARRSDGLRRFVGAYRALARLPAPVLSPVSLDELVDDLRILFAGQALPPPLVVDCPAGVIVEIDRDQMVQALWALLRNAGEAGGPIMPVRLAILLQTDTVLFEVSDHGGGVAMPDRARIFRPFHTDKPDGSGIGLTLARRIARGHGGDINLLNHRPTTFRLALPMR